MKAEMFRLSFQVKVTGFSLKLRLRESIIPEEYTPNLNLVYRVVLNIEVWLYEVLIDSYTPPVWRSRKEDKHRSFRRETEAL